MEIVKRRLRGYMALPPKSEFFVWYAAGIPSQFAFRRFRFENMARFATQCAAIRIIQRASGTCNSSFIETPVKPCVGPRAEDAANYYARGLDVDLNVAMKIAVRETVELLQEKAGLTAAEAHSVASLGVDFRIAEAVDSVQLIYGTIPKKFFKQKPDYWANKQ
jgi:hypothetical protein